MHTQLKKINIDIITCPEWGARQPKRPIQTCSRSERIIFHHTAGHHPEITDPKNESVAECVRYARDIQAFHMRPGGLGAPDGGIDSGHNFLVCRNGLILQGRWLTVHTIQAGHMVWSAHCPNQNDQIGIEHEHKGTETMTKEQIQSSAKLMAWIASQYGRTNVLPVDPHSKHFKTSCPANLALNISDIHRMANDILDGKGL